MPFVRVHLVVPAMGLIVLSCLGPGSAAEPPRAGLSVPTIRKLLNPFPDDLPTEGVAKPRPPTRAPGLAFDDVEAAGLPPGSPVEKLDVEKAYALALIRSRGAGSDRTLDLKDLAARSRRLGVEDFARFCGDFLAGRQADGAFRDPSGAICELLHRRQTLGNAIWHTLALQKLEKVAKYLAETGALSPAQTFLDRINDALYEAKGLVVERKRLYRDQLDELKVELGLSPQVPAAWDAEGLAAFQAISEGAFRWLADPARKPEDLLDLNGRLPNLEVVIENQSLSGLYTREPVDRIEALLLAAARLALKNKAGRQGPGEPEAQSELRIRRRIRLLASKYLAFEIERRKSLVVLRQIDQTEEEGLAESRREGIMQSLLLERDLVGSLGRFRECQDRLVELWAGFVAERLKLYRDLGTLPFDDWEAYDAQFSSRPVP